ncbi:MAG TPA: hypothetical protein VNT32_11510 [Thermoleophilaceae bacterium]|nr:hypothetical protein [Thermoleophilaceae bacterium]
MTAAERFWARRLRWRLRGAWLWPVFALGTVADTLLLHLLPPIRTGVDLAPAFIVAAFGNIVLVGAIAPWLAKRLNARDDSTPYEVVLDRSGTVLLLLGVAGVLASGLATRPLVVSETRDTEAAARAFETHVERTGTPEERANIGTANTLRLADDFFRICVNLNDRRRASCWFVETDREPPQIARDSDVRPNQLYVR